MVLVFQVPNIVIEAVVQEADCLYLVQDRGKEIKDMLVNQPPDMAYLRVSFQNAL